MVAIVRLLVLPLGVVAARVRRLERRMVAALAEAGAQSLERAVPLGETGWLGGHVRHRLIGAGVLRLAPGNRVFLDAAAYDRYRARRRYRAVILMGVLLAGVAVLYFGGAFS